MDLCVQGARAHTLPTVHAHRLVWMYAHTYAHGHTHTRSSGKVPQVRTPSRCLADRWNLVQRQTFCPPLKSSRCAYTTGKGFIRNACPDTPLSLNTPASPAGLGSPQALGCWTLPTTHGASTVGMSLGEESPPDTGHVHLAKNAPHINTNSGNNNQGGTKGRPASWVRPL